MLASDILVSVFHCCPENLRLMCGFGRKMPKRSSLPKPISKDVEDGTDDKLQ
jgi:hypothetical protein